MGWTVGISSPVIGAVTPMTNVRCMVAEATTSATSDVYSVAGDTTSAMVTYGLITGHPAAMA